MPTIEIASLDDERLAPYRDLPDRKHTRRSGLFIVEGTLLVRRLLASSFSAKSLLLDRDRQRDFADMANYELNIFLAPRELMRELAGYQIHSGVLACAERGTQPTLAEMTSSRKSNTLVVLPNVYDPANVGSILRTALALGAGGCLVGKQSADPFLRRAMRASMGAPFKLPVRICDDLATDIASLRGDHRYRIIGAALAEEATSLRDSEHPGKLALLLGNEGEGLTETWLRHCDGLVTIPHAGRADSLNVAVAAGILLHHFL